MEIPIYSVALDTEMIVEFGVVITTKSELHCPAEIYNAESRVNFTPLEGAPLDWTGLNKNIALVDGLVKVTAHM